MKNLINKIEQSPILNAAAWIVVLGLNVAVIAAFLYLPWIAEYFSK